MQLTACALVASRAWDHRHDPTEKQPAQARAAAEFSGTICRSWNVAESCVVWLRDNRNVPPRYYKCAAIFL